MGPSSRNDTHCTAGCEGIPIIAFTLRRALRLGRIAGTLGLIGSNFLKGQSTGRWRAVKCSWWWQKISEASQVPTDWALHQIIVDNRPNGQPQTLGEWIHSFIRGWTVNMATMDKGATNYLCPAPFGWLPRSFCCS